MTDGVHIRRESAADITAVAALNRAAFGRAEEADLVDQLRNAGRAAVALVAERDGALLGHILFSPVTIEHARLDLHPLGLAPMAVRPDRQRTGIGSALVRSGLAACRAAGAGAVVVLGHPTYYPRFGFVPASRFTLRCEYDVPDDTFMARELIDGRLADVRGLVRYAPEFAGV